MGDSLNDLLDVAETRLLDQEEQISHAEIMTDAVSERISRILLCQRMIRNIRMNMTVDDGSSLQMRFNQIRAVSELIRFLEQEGGEDFKGRFKQPTGAGKTILFGVITKLIGVRTLVLVPRQNLLSNTKKEFVEMVGISEGDIGLVGAGSKEIGKQITIATYQSHLSRIKKDKAYRDHVQQCDLIICDEAHRSLGDATRSSIDSIDDADEIVDDSLVDKRLEEDEVTADEERYEEEVFADLEKSTNRQSLKLAFTATPTLAQKDVADHFPYLIAEEKQGDLVKAGILVGYRIVQVTASHETDDFEGYVTEEQEANVLERENVYGKLAGSYAEALKRYQEKQDEADYPLHGVAFCVNIDECDKFAAEAAKYGLRSRIITSREAKGRKGDAVITQAENDLVAQNIDLIITVNKLGEGWNFKPANAAIWARASTSPMVVIQGVGRTCRAHTDEQGRTKPHSLVFETQWSLRGNSDRYSRREDDRVHKKPLTIAQALALNGEDPLQVCSMENGRSLEIEKFETLNEDGTAIVEGIEFAEPVRYIGQKLPFLTNHAVFALLRFYEDMKPVKPAYPVVLRGRIQRCYLKSDLDHVLRDSKYVFPDGTITLTIENPESIDNPTQIEAVYVPAYLEGKVDDPRNWLGHAKDQGLEPIENASAFYRGLGSRQKTIQVELYEKKFVDELILKLILSPKISGRSELLGEGIEIAVPEGTTRTAVFPTQSLLISKILLPDALAEMQRRGFAPIPYVVVGGNGRRAMMYWKDEFEQVARYVTAEHARKKAEENEKRISDRMQKNLEKEREKAEEQSRKSAERTQLIEESVYLEITQQETQGLYHVRYGFLENRKPRKGEGKVVQLDEYISPDLGRILTADEQEIVTKGMSTAMGGPHSREFQKRGFYWQMPVDDRIRKFIVK
jgi:superfamily II DNA or RNA helicase